MLSRFDPVEAPAENTKRANQNPDLISSRGSPRKPGRTALQEEILPSSYSGTDLYPSHANGAMLSRSSRPVMSGVRVLEDL
jgi:hypothetical protein